MTLKFALAATFVSALHAPLLAQTVSAPLPAETVVLSTPNTKLTRAEYERLVIGFSRNSGAPLSGPSNQSMQSGTEVARLLALVDEAKRRGLDRKPEIAALMEVRGYVILANALLAALTEDARNDEAGTRALWESDKSRFVEVEVRQILIRHKGSALERGDSKASSLTDAQAKAKAEALLTKIRAGANFADLARASSDDEATRKLGGALPPFTLGAMQAEFETAAFALAPGAVSAPVKTKFGYHLIEVIDRRPFDFNRVKKSLEFTRAQQKLDALGKQGVRLEPTYFKP